MTPLDDLHPSETEQALAYSNLIQEHWPRSVPIATTNEHACSVCDEIWPCDIAVILAGFRDFRQKAKELSEITIALSDITCAAADMISGLDLQHLTPEFAGELYLRLAAAIEVMKNRQGSV